MHDAAFWMSFAFRNVWRNWRRSALTMILIAIACAALLCTWGFMKASFEGLKYSIVSGGTGHFQIGSKAEFGVEGVDSLERALPSAVARALLAQSVLPGVRQVVPRLYFEGLISNGEHSFAFVGTAVDPEVEWSAFGRSMSVTRGSFLPIGGAKDASVILGDGLAQRLKVVPGQSVTLLAPTVFGSLNAIDVEVVGTYASGVVDRDNLSLMVPLRLAHSLLRSDRVSRVAVLLGASRPNLTGDEFLREAALGDFAKGLEARPWQQLAPVYDQVRRMYTDQFIVLGVILVALVLAACSTTIVSGVLERAREIAILRAIGIRSAALRGAFVLEGAYMALIGAILGVLTTFAISAALNALRIEMPPPPGRSIGYPLYVLTDIEACLFVVAFMVTIGGVAGWLTSRYVSSVDILDVLSQS